MLIPENISFIVVCLKIFAYLCDVESNQIIAGCLNTKFFPYCMYKLSLFNKPTKSYLFDENKYLNIL